MTQAQLPFHHSFAFPSCSVSSMVHATGSKVPLFHSFLKVLDVLLFWIKKHFLFFLFDTQAEEKRQLLDELGAFSDYFLDSFSNSESDGGKGLEEIKKRFSALSFDLQKKLKQQIVVIFLSEAPNQDIDGDQLQGSGDHNALIQTVLDNPYYCLERENEVTIPIMSKAILGVTQELDRSAH